MKLPLSPEEKEKWQKQYKATTEALEAMRARELMNMTEEEAQRQIDLLCAEDPVWRERPDWSGLVEMQRLFQQATKK